MPEVVVAGDIPTETIAPVVQQASPFGMKVNPWFDWHTILGLPAWFWIDIFFVMVLIVVFLYWIFRMKRLASVKGYVIALKLATQEDVMVWVISTTKNLTIECLKKRDSVLSFYDKLNITKWMHDSPMSVVHIGGKGGVIVSEDFYRTRDIVSEIALSKACDEHNQNNPKKPINDYDDYEDFGRPMLQAENPNGIEIPSYSIFDPNKWRKYFPKGYTATFNGGIFIRAARKLKVMTRVPGFWEKLIPIGIFMTIGLIAIIAAWMCPI
jgi:hypothetical protein